MKRRKALLSEEEFQNIVTKERDKFRKASKRASETHDHFAQARTELNTSTLCQGFCTSVLFIAMGMQYLWYVLGPVLALNPLESHQNTAIVATRMKS